ncbi:hypothetical protein [Sphingobacterium haloxyli]|uniref:Uncharacterized protein n=1 Tax=Sphingobacterium haloxyli TaxID=2100533 RepID=A0A2S9J8H5_9SPHI|nr:hypothetical protein [Sphingobacterium haloxyli]PRD49088.1 hypothetical protein C5745_00100 [Sphingobacterium haloxyli]
MSHLKTDNPIALQALLSETLFIPKEKVESAVSPVGSVVDDASREKAEEFIYQGDKSTGILFILRYPDYPYFSPQAEDAFVKTLGALNFSFENVAVVNLANPHNPNDFKRIMQFFQPTKITLLGVEPISLKLPEIAHNAYMKGKVATVFNTFSFEEMFADVQKKRLFWNEFKTFIVS